MYCIWTSLLVYYCIQHIMCITVYTVICCSTAELTSKGITSFLMRRRLFCRLHCLSRHCLDARRYVCTIRPYSRWLFPLWTCNSTCTVTDDACSLLWPPLYILFILIIYFKFFIPSPWWFSVLIYSLFCLNKNSSSLHYSTPC